MPDAQQADLFNFHHPLKHLTKSLKTQRNTKIVAFGSSSTAGKSPVVPFPAYLELMLRGEFGIEKTREFGKRMINVINRGVGGEEASTELPRMQSDVIDEAPSLVIWQVGTNAVLRNIDPADVAKLVEDGVGRIQAAGSDIVLVDPQYSPRVNEKAENAGKMVKLLGRVAELRKIAVFPRFEVMRDWHERQSIPTEEFIVPDGLLMSDWGYSCFAQLLGDDIIKSVGQIKLGVAVPSDVRTYRPM